MVFRNNVSALVILLAASAGCSRPSAIELTSRQVETAFQATLDGARREAQAEAVESSRLETHFGWLRSRGAKPIDEASTRERELARAVVRISTIDGSFGTGFFVSPDGLLLTNEHVVSSGACSRDRCAGFDFARGFSPQGDYEVFRHARAVAFSPAEGGADFALLQIELPPGRTVPYLALEMGDIGPAVQRAAEQGSLRLIGHPFGAPARVLPVDPVATDDRGRQLSYLSLGTPGTSGSPIVDVATGRVLALNSQLRLANFQDEVAFDGSLRRATNIGTLSQEILRHLREAYPELAGRPELSGSDFVSWTSHAAERRLRSITLPGTPPGGDANATHPEVAPSLAEFFLAPEQRSALKLKPAAAPAEMAFFHHFYGTRYAAERWDALLESLAQAGQPRAVLDLFSTAAMVHRATGVPIPTTEEKFTSWVTRLSRAESVSPQELVKLQLGVARELGIEIRVDGQLFDCPAFIAGQQGEPLELAVALADLCGSRELPRADGTTVNGFELLRSAAQAPPGRWNEETDTYMASQALQRLAMAAPWTDAELATARRIAHVLVERSSTWAMISQMESLVVELERKPESAVPGSQTGLLDAYGLPTEAGLSAELERLHAALRLPEPEPVNE